MGDIAGSEVPYLGCGIRYGMSNELDVKGLRGKMRGLSVTAVRS
jgi:hypothetical protein